MESTAKRYFRQISDCGGMLSAISKGYFRGEIAEAAYRYQCAVDRGSKKIVGVTDFVEADEEPIEIHQVDPAVEEVQVQRLRKTKRIRSPGAVKLALDALRRAAQEQRNVFPELLAAANARATVGETMNAMADVFGRYSLTQP
jgi:methylmalonyl-CoA mutase N-terminal domain/subunit